MKPWLICSALVVLTVIASSLETARYEQSQKMWFAAWSNCSPALYVNSTNAEDAAQFVKVGTYACVFLSDGTYGRFVWHNVADDKGAAYVAHMEHFYQPLGRWKP